VVGNQRPCITKGLRILENSPQSLQKLVPVDIAAEYRPTFNAPDHNVVQCTSSVDSRFPWHQPLLSLPCLLRQPKNLTASPFHEEIRGVDGRHNERGLLRTLCLQLLELVVVLRYRFTDVHGVTFSIAASSRISYFVPCRHSVLDTESRPVFSIPAPAPDPGSSPGKALILGSLESKTRGKMQGKDPAYIGHSKHKGHPPRYSPDGDMVARTWPAHS
jgi:hypothetical protein